jgi:hypothetical protein
MVILDSPELLLGDTSPTTDNTWFSSSAFASTTLPDASAVKAILKFGGSTFPSIVAKIRLYARAIGSGDAIGANSLIAYGSEMDAATLQVATCTGQTTVNLDANSDFEYAYDLSAGAGSESVTIYLIGYYV